MDSGLVILISRASFNSIIQSFVDPQVEKSLKSSITMSVEDLEDLIENYSVAFDERSKIKIVSTIDQTF